MKSSYIKSPCVRNCCLNEKDICLGCYRTLTEITQWSLVDDFERQQILKKASQRKQKKLNPINYHLRSN